MAAAQNGAKYAVDVLVKHGAGLEAVQPENVGGFANLRTFPKVPL